MAEHSRPGEGGLSRHDGQAWGVCLSGFQRRLGRGSFLDEGGDWKNGKIALSPDW